ncbi:enoyl-CoA hydratase/isomerase family protein [Aurantiacibacter xanthus]|uniref:Enoyl-CoA hydratase/isomerase family protein n=1 Tax=Aurantiacibacter xanthus TaxID=1784712 RepID=A0A3A1P508_9SPHN|nr:enoyl-CoA hydratase/isomerase family protein [Aurantiacibacter xanthus]RIV81970.1 enoyl-CoA hydratase/isomerase family protein [Aurantiacibacter xanthus]
MYGKESTDAVRFGAFSVELQDNGVALVTFSRPPVNALSLKTYEDIREFAEFVSGNDRVKVIVLTAPDDARAWCGGADLREFEGMTAARRKERYEFINECLPQFHRIDRPMIAAIRSAAIGVGVMLAGMCDLRVASNDARIACPEVDYGLIGGSAGLLASLRMPEAKVREMVYTGRAFTAKELESTGFFNYVVPRSAVLPLALDLADTIAGKSLPALKARKLASLMFEGPEWMDAYLTAQEASSALVENPESNAAVRAALGKEPEA